MLDEILDLFGKKKSKGHSPADRRLDDRDTVAANRFPPRADRDASDDDDDHDDHGSSHSSPRTSKKRRFADLLDAD